MKIVSIHQPSFLPWIGFFEKIYRSDDFVLLTMATRSKNDKYLTRVEILNNERAKYLSIPLGVKQLPINQLHLPSGDKWKIKMLNLIKGSYEKSDYFDTIYTDLEFLLMKNYEYFFEYSINIIFFLVDRFNIHTKLHIDNSFECDFGVSNHRNIAICKKLGGSVYLSGNGAKAYNDITLYDDSSIKLIYQNYKPMEYRQMSTAFMPGLSVIDSMFNQGYRLTERLIKNNAKLN